MSFYRNSTPKYHLCTYTYGGNLSSIFYCIIVEQTQDFVHTLSNLIVKGTSPVTRGKKNQMKTNGLPGTMLWASEIGEKGWSKMSTKCENSKCSLQKKRWLASLWSNCCNWIWKEKWYGDFADFTYWLKQTIQFLLKMHNPAFSPRRLHHHLDTFPWYLKQHITKLHPGLKQQIVSRANDKIFVPEILATLRADGFLENGVPRISHPWFQK